MALTATTSFNAPAITAWAVALLLLVSITPTDAKGFLYISDDSVAGTGQEGREVDIRRAFDTVMGCGGNAGHEKLAEIERDLLPIWKAVPKNRYGKVEWRALRYMAHRFFMKRSSLLIRGFEPGRRLNGTETGVADILNHKVPAFAESLIAGGKVQDGYDLQDAISMVATLEQLIFDSESSLLETIYFKTGESQRMEVSRRRAEYILETYMLFWIVGETEQEFLSLLMRNTTMRETELPNWRAVRHFLQGRIKALDYKRHKNPRAYPGKDVLEQRYNYNEVHEIVGGITQGFASFWESECQDIKAGLVALDHAGTGRVRLSEFYGASVNGEWRYAESESYLRELGVLDESSVSRGKQVIIPNYLNAASNCIVGAKHYLVCCVNECEATMGEIEAAVQEPLADPMTVLAVVENITSYEDGASSRVSRALREQLHVVAKHHGGKVPLHGRLFAQWLHYAFPRECPFPHKTGIHITQTPSEFGEDAIATMDTMKTEAEKNADGGPIDSSAEEEFWMTQWSQEEELVMAHEMRAPWEGKSSSASVIVLALLAVGAIAMKLKGASSGVSSDFMLPMAACHMKAHVV
mmetsp:Transcript_52653/g.125795  ORF Transcript_52653/g.125795 Transcript_52653/m.125795 type:complete len:581 (-) Transcript_52653:48-1790(-)